jgi:hypothetical protein
MQSNFCVNRNDWSDRPAPFTQLTGEPYEWGDEDHAFGTLVTFLVPEECRDDTYRPPGERGIWMRRDCSPGVSGSVHSAVVVPIEWDPDQRGWVLLPTVVSNSFKVHAGVFPLRMRPPVGRPRAGFEEFVDAIFDPLLVAAGVVPGALEEGTPVEVVEDEEQYLTADEEEPESDGEVDQSESDEGEAWEVERIINSKVVKGITYYLVKWKGFSRKHDSWEPESCVCADELVGEYRRGKGSGGARGRGAVRAYMAELEQRTCCFAAALTDPVLSGDEDILSGGQCMGPVVDALGGVEEAERAVGDLHMKQKVGGRPEEFIQPYLDEFGSVSGRRLRELSPEEAERVRAEVLVPKLRMLLSIKRSGRRKCRLILQGFSEPHEWDEGRSVDSPVAYLTTLRMLMAMVGAGDVVSQRDVSVAFLQSMAYGPEERKRYCSYQAYKGAVQRMFALLGPLYGQRSASRRWYETLASWLTSDAMGFVQGCNEPCLFRHPVTGLVVVIYVDDVITRGNGAATAEFQAALGAEFECTAEQYLGVDNELDFLGFTLSKEVVDGEVFYYMDQQGAVEELLLLFERESLQLRSSPMPSTYLFDSDPAPVSANAAAIYKHVVGVLNYLARCTRFDVGFAVSRLSRKMGCPDEGAWKAMIHLLGYLRSTVGFRIGGSVSGSVNTFHFYVDSDHASDRAKDSRSQTGFLIFLNSFPVDWCSRRQPSTAVSPAEAEIYAMREVVVAGRLVQWVAAEMGLDTTWPFKVHSDSMQAVSFQKATAPNSKLRGCFDLREKFVNELRDQKVVTSEHIPRALNMADMLTHCLSGPKFQQCLGLAQNLRSYSCRGACLLIYSHSSSCQNLTY